MSVFFFSSRRRHTRSDRDWSSDVCSSDLPAGCRIIVSPALRAQQTAQALERGFETVQEIGGGASVAAVLEAVHWPRALEPALVVGHQPTLGRVASFLLAG